MKLASKVFEKRWVVASKNNIINVTKKIDKILLLMKDKKRRVNATTRKKPSVRRNELKC